MTDYLRPMAAYVATWNGHRHNDTDYPGHAAPTGMSTPDSQADSSEDNPDNGADSGWTQ